MTDDVSIIRGTNTKPVASAALAQFFSTHSGYRGQLFIGYPIIGTSDGRHPIDALFISETQGIVIFDLIEGTELGDYQVRQDDSANKLEARLKAHRELVERRTLQVPIRAISFAPGLTVLPQFGDADYPISTLETLPEALRKFQWDDRRRDIYEAVLSALQSISTIRQSRTKRVITREDSRGAKLKILESSIATLDTLQSKAVLETVDGVQRIRGLAGSGKTIVLALKAAYLHAQHPDWKIAVTFNTRSLKGQFRRLINNFVLEQTQEEPDWDNLRILNAWGAPGSLERSGVYFEFCHAHNLPYLDYGAAKTMFGRGSEFSGACNRAIADLKAGKALYDAVLVDEAQDFPPSFLRLCFELLDEHKRLVYAYDELQNLGAESLPSPEDMFGKSADGSPLVTLDRSGNDGGSRDIILEKCYRNSRPVLVTAHSLGFGIYRPSPKNRTTGLVQLFDNAPLWEDIGYRVKAGTLSEGSEVTLARTQESSPRFLEDHSSLGDLVQFIKFETEEDQARWVSDAVMQNLNSDELRHDDIVVINPDPITTREKVGLIRRILLEKGVNSHLAGVDTDPDIFFRTDSASVTFTGIYRAKGNEAGMVYVINAHDCQSSAYNLSTIRNRLFTAITRSKAWVRVLGVGPAMQRLIEEYKTLEEHHFELQFRYPTKSERVEMTILHRDVSTAGKKRLRERKKSLVDLVSDLESGAVHAEDIDDDVKAKLKVLLAKKA